MNTRRITTAFVIALTVSGLCTWALGRKVHTSNANIVPDVRYVSAKAPIQAGTVLKPDDLVMVNWPGTHPILGSFTKIDDVAGRSTLYPLDNNQPITDHFLAAVGSGTGLAGKIPAGMRAIALRSDEVMGVAGFLFPGSHLDVLVTYRTDKSPDPVTLTVLQDAEVLAAGQKVQPDPDGKPVTATVVTLLLNPEDAQRAVLASTQGAIHFVLRSGSDKAHVQESALSLSELSGLPSPRVNGATAPRVVTTKVSPVTRPQFVVETIIGDKQSADSFSGAK